jgi:hypothetical protein
MQVKFFFAGILPFLVLIEATCSNPQSVIYHTTSKDGSMSLQLITFSRFPLPGNVARLELFGPRGKIILRDWRANDMYPCFVSAAWALESQAVVVLFRNCWHGSEVAAFNTETGRPVNPSGTKASLAEKIRSEYGLPETVRDPIAWAQETEQARNSFADKMGIAAKRTPGR